MTYFTNVRTVGEAKVLYRTLAKENHPDLHGYEFTPIMQAINAEYHAILESFDGSTSLGSDGKEHKYHYNADIEQELVDKISELLGLRLEGIEIELIGTWIWVSGDTKPVKDKLGRSGAGLTWHGQRGMWYWRRAGYKRRYNKKASMNDLRQMYGSRVFEQDESATGMVAA
jgi:hypothetical protein